MIHRVQEHDTIELQHNPSQKLRINPRRKKWDFTLSDESHDVHNPRKEQKKKPYCPENSRWCIAKRYTSKSKITYLESAVRISKYVFWLQISMKDICCIAYPMKPTAWLRIIWGEKANDWISKRTNQYEYILGH